MDYFNEFLLNPSLVEKVKFNFVSGDLELIENELESASQIISARSETKESDKIILKPKIGKQSPLPKPQSTAEFVKKKLEGQLKSIIKKAPTSSNGRMSSKSNKSYKSTKSEKHEIAEAKNKQMFEQVNKHSFKDLDLIKIESAIEPTDLKDPKATAEAKIPVLKTRYSVNVLKKPFSMSWLRYRRLTLFLHSELYSEFKLAMILAQFALFNNESKLIFNLFNLRKLEI